MQTIHEVCEEYRKARRARLFRNGMTEKEIDEYDEMLEDFRSDGSPPMKLDKAGDAWHRSRAKKMLAIANKMIPDPPPEGFKITFPSFLDDEAEV